MIIRHTIFLRGPWQYRVIPAESDDNLAPEDRAAGTATVRAPFDWESQFADRPQCVRFDRVFHAPTGLEPGDRVRIGFPPSVGSGQILVNDEVLGQIAIANKPTLVDLTDVLRTNNRVTVWFRPDYRHVQANESVLSPLSAPVAIQIVAPIHPLG